ncbi:MAG: DUF5610 domain-containing protein [Methylococcales bacterium]|nr:DUF5610 domain-containing protein [Methylococcales bacterium]
METVTSTSRFSQRVVDIKVSHNKQENDSLGQQISAVSDEKNAKNPRKMLQSQFNTSILQANINVSEGLYKIVIRAVNDALKADFGDNAIQNVYDSELGVSPEATADRIISMSTAFFPSFRQQNLDLNEEQAAVKFAEIIAGAIDKGFEDARDVLTGLNVLEGDIASNIDTTYNLVQQGLQVFVDSYV